jgi:hypothetical protein
MRRVNANAVGASRACSRGARGERTGVRRRAERPRSINPEKARKPARYCSTRDALPQRWRRKGTRASPNSPGGSSMARMIASFSSSPRRRYTLGFDAQSCSEGPFEQSRSSSAGKAGLRRDLRLLETRRATEHLRKLQSRMVFEKRDAPFRHVQATEPTDPLENVRLRE